MGAYVESLGAEDAALALEAAEYSLSKRVICDNIMSPNYLSLAILHALDSLLGLLGVAMPAASLANDCFLSSSLNLARIALKSGHSSLSDEESAGVTLAGILRFAGCLPFYPPCPFLMPY